jgi:hypothetical protein
MEEEQENYKYNKQRERLIRETSLAKTKAEEFHYLAIAQKEHMGAMAAMEQQQAKYEMNKKLWEEREKTETLKRETEKLKFYDDEQQMNDYHSKMMVLTKEQGAAEHDKLKYSLIKKANDAALQSVYDAHISETQILLPEHLEKIENDIKANRKKLQELHYQRTKNDLLAKGQKTFMEISSVVAANDGLEIDVANRINTLTSLINNLTEQINNLHQRINQQSNETNEIKIAALQQLGDLQLQIAKLQLEKQNMEMYIKQISSQ